MWTKNVNEAVWHFSTSEHYLGCGLPVPIANTKLDSVNEPIGPRCYICWQTSQGRKPKPLPMTPMPKTTQGKTPERLTAVKQPKQRMKLAALNSASSKPISPKVRQKPATLSAKRKRLRPINKTVIVARKPHPNAHIEEVIAAIQEIERLRAENALNAQYQEQRHYTKDGFVMEKCSECRKWTCLKISGDIYIVHDVTLLNNSGSQHICEGTRAECDAPSRYSAGGFETNRRKH